MLPEGVTRGSLLHTHTDESMKQSASMNLAMPPTLQLTLTFARWGQMVLAAMLTSKQVCALVPVLGVVPRGCRI